MNTPMIVREERLTIEMLARRAGMHPAMIQRCIEYGLIEPAGHHGATLLFEPASIVRLRKIARLHDSLGINLAGISVILDLLDRIQVLQRSHPPIK